MKKKTQAYKQNFSDADDADSVPKKWFEENLVLTDPKDFTRVTEQVVIELKDEAKKCLDSEVATYNIKNSKTNPNYNWLKTVMYKGTVSDKVAACTVAIQDNPMCNLDILQNLVGMVKLGKKKECTMVIDTLTELFLTDLLRPDEKLRTFFQRPLSLLNDLSSGNILTRRKILSLWYFEDQLKELYTTFVLALNSVAHDVLDANKEKAISAIFKLLAGNPEQEKNLLSYLVNKLGDPSQKIASKAIYNLGQLLCKHPNMQEVVLSEVEKLIFRSNISSKAQYYGLCFLSQFCLSHETPEVARRLIEVYFSFFKACIKKGEVDTRMMSALLMGVNRAYPYAKLEMNKISEHIDTMYRVVHIANFNIGLHALSLLFQVSDNEENLSDRLYSALYKKLIDPKLLTTTYQAMLLSLIYKALLKDKDLARVKVFIKRLLQLSLFMQPAFACGVLYLISQLLGKKSNIQCLISKQDKIIDTEEDDEEKYHDILTNEEFDIKQESENIRPTVTTSATQPSWNHTKNLIKNKRKEYKYNPLNRNPLYAGGEFCAYTELMCLKNHHHPTIALYATNIMDGTVTNYSGDPLKDFTLIRFLDRFVYKNPKKSKEVQGAHPTFGKRKSYNPKGARALRITSENYLNANFKNIPVDEHFMYSYLKGKYKDQKHLKTDEDDDTDVESVKSEEFEDMLDKMAGISKEDDLDFMNEIGVSLKTKEKNKSAKDSLDNDDDDYSDENEDDIIMSDEESSVTSDEDIEMNDDDIELLKDADEEDEELVFEEEKYTKNKNKSKNSGSDISTLFASAEEFASLLEDEGSSKIAPGGSNTFSNKDNADTKQIAWEENRNKWLHGFAKALGKSKGAKGSNYGKRRNSHNGYGNNVKKSKK